ncbi:hypothetical protein NQ317_004934 [Molorchus minor]|uniref:SWI/SNF-related matrix-associated actin-dependent regulator of chromatin subfamily A-like protein 1 n=1 Tax=Molorchus minor TaxID=1323400 RepID=A0ABQ9JUM5_9CUCU|nr:hypothetical protein NQ317_004934 [Molorchus minor]
MNKTPSKQQFYGQQLIAKCVLTSSERFCVELDGFLQGVIDSFKTIGSRIYDPKTRTWSFNIKDYNLFLTKLGPLQSKVVIQKLPSFILTCLNTPQNEVEIDYDKLDPVLSSSLLPFQVEGLKFGIAKNGRCLIADDMGLGKTFQALAIANYYMNDWPLLIATTASMKTVWEETIRKYLPSVSVMQVQYMVSGKDYIGDSKILIVSHDMMKRALDRLLEKGFGVVIIDESHVLKCFKTQNFKAASLLAKKAKRIILLSGTPALSKPSELFTQLSLIDDKFFKSFYTYSERYCDGKQTNFGWDASGKSNLQELEIILSRKFMIRRTKEDVIKALPNKEQEIIKLDTKLNEFSENDKKVLNALANKYNTQKNGAEKHALLLTYFAETAKLKIPSVCSHILQVLEKKIKFIVFAHHQTMINAIDEVLKKKNVKHIRIDGNTGTDQRKFFISKFQTDDNYMCAVLSITSCNAGITLTAASLVLFAELHWNPSILSQAESRAHRIGQQNTVTVQYLLAPGTADDSIWTLLQEKQDTLKEIGLSKDSFDNMSLKQQCSNDNVTDGLNISSIGESSFRDITSYFTPEKKRKHSQTDDDVFNDGFDDILCKVVEKEEEMFNDGMDDILCKIDF